MSGDALAVALDLLRTPAMRGLLRSRPLPDDVGELIELAAGEPARVARVAASRGEAPTQVLEAARFYVREILLFAGADAYRVLGVAPGASAEQIKLHHRHLQHWLHPDRRGNDWESAFATRINAAWSELRTPERRAAYQARQWQDRKGAAPSRGQRRLVSQWRASPFQQRRGVGWLVVGAAVAACVWLAVLIDREATAPALEWNPTRADAASTEPPSQASDYQAALDYAAALRADGAQAELAMPPARAAVRAPDPLPQRMDSVAHLPTPASIAPSPSPPPPPLPLPLPSPLPEQPRTRIARPATQPPAYTAWVEDEARDVVAARPAPAIARRASARASAPAPVPAPEPAGVPELASASALAAAPAVAPAAPALTPQRVSLLRSRAGQLSRYLGGASGPVPPIWRNVPTQDKAVALRGRLGSGRVRFSEPAWRISAEHASMTMRLQPSGSPLELRAGFAWRDGMWLVDSLHTEDLP